MDRETIQRFVRKQGRKGDTPQEQLCWEIAAEARYGGIVIPTTMVNPYLLRVYLCPERLGGGEGTREYMHFFFRGDEDDWVHNHPWRKSRSFILTTGYIDHRWNQKLRTTVPQIYAPGDFNVLEREDYHRVELLDPDQGCWTFFCSTDRLASSDGTDWDFFNPQTGEKELWGKHVSRNHG